MIHLYVALFTIEAATQDEKHVTSWRELSLIDNMKVGWLAVPLDPPPDPSKASLH